MKNEKVKKYYYKSENRQIIEFQYHFGSQLTHGGFANELVLGNVFPES